MSLSLFYRRPGAGFPIGLCLKLELGWQVIRPMFSNPPRHGAAIVVRVLSDPALYADWRVRPPLPPLSLPDS